jgi:hypothetical protein
MAQCSFCKTKQHKFLIKNDGIEICPVCFSMLNPTPDVFKRLNDSRREQTLKRIEEFDAQIESIMVVKKRLEEDIVNDNICIKNDLISFPTVNRLQYLLVED